MTAKAGYTSNRPNGWHHGVIQKQDVHFVLKGAHVGRVMYWRLKACNGWQWSAVYNNKMLGYFKSKRRALFELKKAIKK